MDRLYLVTGAAGHLGGEITRQLTESGKSVRVLVLPKEKNLPKSMEIHFGDTRDKESLRPCFENLRGRKLIVIHCAAIVSIASKFNQTVYDVNVMGTKNITDLCMEYAVSKLVYISSVHAIAEAPRGMVIRETDQFNPNKVVGLYAKTKAEATAYVLDSAKKGLNACIIHPSGITGPYDMGRG
ncbi:MAG: NAD-dependent epimerase/dehydratase family protein, partial [Clostridiales bacterium]|nr:NAD-dependent epimerase/dehydratase family protein [Clostridiales bacterium]